jgi:hypothetical protein
MPRHPGIIMPACFPSPGHATWFFREGASYCPKTAPLRDENAITLDSALLGPELPLYRVEAIF